LYYATPEVRVPINNKINNPIYIVVINKVQAP